MKFRGKTKDGQVEIVFGYYARLKEKHVIIMDNAREYYRDIPYPSIGDYNEIDPESLAQSTGLKDKNDTMIFGSIEIDGELSNGGDHAIVFGVYDGRVYFDGGEFRTQHHHLHEVRQGTEVDGTQFED